MRVLLGCSLGGLGHLTPVVAAAQSLGRLGHDAVVLVPPALADAATEAGVAVHVGDEPPRPVIDAMWIGCGQDHRTRSPGSWTASSSPASATLRHAISAALADPRHRRAAGRLAAEIAVTPTLDEALARLLPGETL